MQIQQAAAGTPLGNVRGGITGAMVALGIVLPLGLLAFAALGPQGATLGVRAAFVTAVVGGLVATVVGGAPIPGSIPKTATTLIFASFVATLAKDPRLVGPQGPDVAAILTLTSLCVAASGVLQLVFGLTRVGSLVKYVPLPVVAGFMDGVAILIAISQIRPLLGLPGAAWEVDVAEALRDLRPWGLALGLATAAVAWGVGRRWPRAPWSLAGFAFGMAVYAIVRYLAPDLEMGAMRGSPGDALPQAHLVGLLLSGSLPSTVAGHLPQLLTTAAVIAIIGAMDALLSAVAMDATLNVQHDSNRLLIGQGIATLAVAVLGGLPVVYSTAVPLSIHRAGGGGRLSGVAGTVTLLVVVMVGGRVLSHIPSTVSAAIMVIVALGLFDQWSGRVWREMRVGGGSLDAKWSLAVVLLVCLTTIVFGFVVAIAVGVFLSFVLFIVAMNRSLVRSVATGETRSSRRIYTTDQAQRLRELGKRIRVIELEGAVFFGTAETLEQQVDRLTADARFVVLDLRRVTTIDASGAMTLERIARRLAVQGVVLLQAGITHGGRHARALRAYGAFLHGADRHWFGDVDHALEFAERALLAAAGVTPPEVELPLTELPLLDALTGPQQHALERRLERLELAAGEVLFRKGEPGDRLYVLAKGSVTVTAGTGADVATAQRLASFTSGVIFGETAMLDGGGRTATGVADAPAVVYVLTRAALDDIRRADPALASQVLLNLARQISARLRFASATIQAADY